MTNSSLALPQDIEVSIVIRAFNEEKHLGALLEGIYAQENKNFEVILVDSGSFDRTREIAKNAGVRIIEIESRDFTFGFSLNEGIRAAQGRYIAIVSAHTAPVHSNWLENLIAPLRQPQVAMTYGRQQGNSLSKFSEFQDFRRTYGDRPLELRPPRFFANNANSAIRKDLWEEFPFDETLPGLEDIAWAKHWMKKGWSVRYVPNAPIYHIHEESWSQIFRRYYREAVAARVIEVKSRRSIAREGMIALWSTIEDLALALVRGKFGIFAEILRFRYFQFTGTARGLLDTTALKSLQERAANYFDRGNPSVLIAGPGKSSLNSFVLPRIKPSEVLIRNEFVGVCGTDLEILEGSLGYYKSGQANYPIVPGHELCGRVVSVGAKVTEFKEGQRVVVECIQGCGSCTECKRQNGIACLNRTEMGVFGRHGGYSKYTVVSSSFVHRVPDSIRAEQAVLCEPLAVVMKGFRRLKKTWPTDIVTHRCGVLGAGSIGNLFSRVLAHYGHTVTVFDKNESRLEGLNDIAFGVSSTISGLNQYDTLVETTGNPVVLNQLLKEAAPGACILLLGFPYKEFPFNFENIVANDHMVVGSVGSSRQDFEMALSLLPRLNVSEFTKRILPLEDFEKGWGLFKKQENLKVILSMEKL